MTSAQFSSLSESTLSDLQSCNKFEDEQFEDLATVVVTYLVEQSKSNQLLSQLEEFSEEHSVSLTGLKNVTKSLINITNFAVRQSISHEQLLEELQNLGLSQEKATAYSEKYKHGFVSLSRGALAQTLMVNQLVDMEWKFGVTAASSEVNKVGNTFLQLKLVINKGEKAENVYMELTLPQFYSFLHEMDRAKASLEFFS